MSSRTGKQFDGTTVLEEQNEVPRKLPTLCIQNYSEKLTLMEIDLAIYSSLEDLRRKLRPDVYPKIPNCQLLQINLMFTIWERGATYAKHVIFENHDNIPTNKALTMFCKTIWLDAMPGFVFPSLPPNDDPHSPNKDDQPDKDRGPPASSYPDNTHCPSPSSISEPTSPLSELPASQKKEIDLMLATCVTSTEKQSTQVDGHRVHNAHSEKNQVQRKLPTLCIQNYSEKLTLMDIDLAIYSSLEDLRRKLRPDVYPKIPNCQLLQINLVFTIWERGATYAKHVIFENHDNLPTNKAITMFRKTIWLDAMPGFVFPSLPPNDDPDSPNKDDQPDKDRGPPASSDPDNTHCPSPSSISEPTSPLSELPPSPKESGQEKEMDLMSATCVTSTEKQLTQVDGHRVRNAHSLKVCEGQDFIPCNGRWNFKKKEIDRPFTPSEEDQQWRRSGPTVRVDMMFEQIKLKLPGPPKFLLCVLPERKDSDFTDLGRRFFFQRWESVASHLPG